MATCKETVAVRIMLAVQVLLAVFTLVLWSQSAALRKVHGDAALAVRCRNLLPDRTAAVVNGVYVPPGAVRSVPISRSKPNVFVQLVVTGKPLNQALNAAFTVPVSPSLVNLPPRILVAVELTTRSKPCAGSKHCEPSQYLCLKTPLALLGYFGFQKCPTGSDVPAASPVLASPSPSTAPHPSHPPGILKRHVAIRRGIMVL